MKTIIISLCALIILSSCKKKTMEKPIIYPETKKTDQVDVYFGTQVPDPYNWLENDTAPEVGVWVKAQNAVTRQYLDAIPYRNAIKDRLTKLWNYPKYGVPRKEGSRYFFSKNDGLQQQSALYVLNSLDSEPKLFLDPNKLSDDGTISLTGYNVSNDGNYFAYGISRSGSDWTEFYVMDVNTGKLLKDHLKWIKWSGISWYKDGFFYSRYDQPKTGTELSEKNKNHKVYYHKIGTDQSKDVLIFTDPTHPDYTHVGVTTDDERFLVIFSSESTNGTAVRFKNLSLNDKDFTLIDKGFEFEYDLIDNIGDTLLFKTNNKAPNYKLIGIDTKYPLPEKWFNIIPQKDYLLESVSVSAGTIVTVYMKDVVSKAYQFDLKGKLRGEIVLPGPGTLSGFSGKNSDSVAFYAFTSFTYPTTVFKYDPINNQSEIYKASEIDFDFADYETKQVFFNSKDGTKVPMFLTSKKGIKLDGKNPVLLYGYGGFNVSLFPGFSITNLVFLENGGIYAQVNLRGGGEYGEAWHKAGMTTNKQNVFDDFIAAAEYLIKEKYTSSEKLAIKGGSNGGLLVGACMTQRPELFKVAIPEVGVMDMLKFHTFTIGGHWADEYGSSENEEQFRYLLKYSPLHNLKEGEQYPATLVTTADHDDRVVPAHSFKFIATLQEKHVGTNPVLIRIEEKAGHGAGMPTSKIIDEYTDIWSFIFKNLGIEPKF